jgi:putative hemolysin
LDSDPCSSSSSAARLHRAHRRPHRGLLLIAIPATLPLALGLSTVIEFVVLALLLVLSGLFSGSEVALFSIGSTEKEDLRQDSSRAARRVLTMLQRPRRLLITILLANNLVNVGAAILATVLTIRAAAAYGLNETVLFVLQVVLLTFLLLVFSEITPKLIATRRSIAFSKATSILVYPSFKLLKPVTAVLARGMESLHGRIRTRGSMISSEDIKTLADLGEREGTLHEDERALIHSIVEFGDTTVREIMVSRLDVHALPDKATLDEAFALIRNTGHSRFPVFREHLDSVVGILYAKDLIPYLHGNGQTGNSFDLSSILRPARFVPMGRKLDDMLADFQASGTHFAVVVDEYGGTTGIVTLEDILEEIVGEIRDEHDQPEALQYERISDRLFRVDAGIDLDDLNDAFDLNLDTAAFDFETLGGLIFHLVGDIPEEGTEAEYDRLHLRVEEVDNNRVATVLVEILPAAADNAHQA